MSSMNKGRSTNSDHIHIICGKNAANYAHNVKIATRFQPLKRLVRLRRTHVKIMSKNSFTCFWDKIIVKLNIAAGGNNKIRVLAKDITPHTFRYAYATMLYYAGVDINTAQYLLGHSSITMTMEIYTHIDVSKTKAAADKLNTLIASSQKVVSDETM